VASGEAAAANAVVMVHRIDDKASDSVAPRAGICRPRRPTRCDDDDDGTKDGFDLAQKIEELDEHL